MIDSQLFLPGDYFLVLFYYNPSGKVIIAKEELDCVDVDGIGKVEDLPRLVFIDEECENLKVAVHGGELTRNINKKKKPVVLQAYRCPLCDKC